MTSPRWQEYARVCSEVLALRGEPVAVTYTFSPPPAAARRVRVCEALLLARDGETVVLSASTQSCGGGNMHLGLAPRPGGAASKPLKDFLVSGEKLFCSYAAFHRSQTSAPPPPLGLADYVVLSPLGGAALRPDVVVFVVDATQACRLLTLDIYHDGVPPKTWMGGATCYQAITYPLVTGETNVSLMDYTSRKIKGYDRHDLIVTVPYERMAGIIEAVPLSTAGTAPFEVTEGFGRGQREEGGGN